MDELVDLRRLRSDDPRRRDPAGHGLTLLTKQIAIPTEVLKRLRFHEDRFVRAVAVGKNAYAAVLLGRSAARVLGMWVVSLGEERVEVCLPSTQVPPTYRRNKKVVCRRRKVPYLDEVHGVRVTLPVRTFIDIARDHGFCEGLIAADWLLARGYTREDLLEGLRRMGKMPNGAVVRRCIEHAKGKSESPYESLARAILIEAGFVNIRVQVPVGGYRLDLLIDDLVALEVDGDVKYSEGAELTILEENNRQKALMNEGFVFLRYRPQELREEPGRVVRQVRGASQRVRVGSTQ
ncbi:DUF559 domain-containing protein [Corynebacterium liangguodongii]|uniref:DUF559 domain-containing protein n=1 Tax=Corynebacterium liangguodongii TaxID=2079535 RepID=UPI001304C6AE|nr:DUF559 domain-containing protein [Corynebacterium liangguodongii]